MGIQRKGRLLKGGISRSEGGRIAVLTPNYPEAPKSQYVLRSHLVWESHHEPLPEGFIIHHKNGVASDDRIENLEVMTRADHARLHKPGHGVGWLKRLRTKLIEIERGGQANEGLFHGQ